MGSEVRLMIEIDVDLATDVPWVEFDDRANIDRPVVLHVNRLLTLTFESHHQLRQWLTAPALAVELRYGRPDPPRPPEPEQVEELGTPLAYGRGRPPSDPWRVS